MHLIDICILSRLKKCTKITKSPLECQAAEFCFDAVHVYFFDLFKNQFRFPMYTILHRRCSSGTGRRAEWSTLLVCSPSASSSCAWAFRPQSLQLDLFRQLREVPCSPFLTLFGWRSFFWNSSLDWIKFGSCTRSERKLVDRFCRGMQNYFIHLYILYLHTTCALE